MITSKVLDLYENHNHHVTGWNDVLLNLASLQFYALPSFTKALHWRTVSGSLMRLFDPYADPVNIRG